MKQTKTRKNIGLLLAFNTAFLLATPVLALLLLGFILDSIFHTTPFLIITGTIVGFIGGIINVFQLLENIE